MARVYRFMQPDSVPWVMFRVSMKPLFLIVKMYGCRMLYVNFELKDFISGKISYYFIGYPVITN